MLIEIKTNINCKIYQVEVTNVRIQSNLILTVIKIPTASGSEKQSPAFMHF